MFAQSEAFTFTHLSGRDETTLRVRREQEGRVRRVAKTASTWVLFFKFFIAIGEARLEGRAAAGLAPLEQGRNAAGVGSRGGRGTWPAGKGTGGGPRVVCCRNRDGWRLQECVPPAHEWVVVAGCLPLEQERVKERE